MMRNEKEMTLKLRRIDVCDLLLACLAAKELANDGGEKWETLHQMVRDQLDAFDETLDKIEEYNKPDYAGIKKDLQKVIGQIRKDRNSQEECYYRNFPKAMMTDQQVGKRTATVNCGGEWGTLESTKEIADLVMNDNRFIELCNKRNLSVKMETNNFGTVQIRINY